MTSKISPRKGKEDEEDGSLDQVGRVAASGVPAAKADDKKPEHAANEVGARLKTPQGAILVPGVEIIKEASRKKDAIIANANAKADEMIEKAKAEAAKEAEKTLQAARQKAGKEKERIIEDAQKQAKKARSISQADASRAAGSVFSKVFGEMF